MTTEPHVVQVDSSGRLALTQMLLSPVGLHEGDRVLVFPLRPGLVYLYLTALRGQAECLISANRELVQQAAARQRLFECLTPEEFLRKYLE